MTIETLQNELRDRVKLLVTDAEADVIEMPDMDDDFKLPKGAKGKIVVAYQQSEMSDTVTVGPTAQVEKVMIIVTLQSRTLYGANGVYTLYRKTKTQLHGYRPADCDKPLKAKYFGPPEAYSKPKVDEIWTFEFHLETMAPYIQEAEFNDVVDGTPDDPDTELPYLPDDAVLIVPTSGQVFEDMQNIGASAMIEIVDTVQAVVPPVAEDYPEQ